MFAESQTEITTAATDFILAVECAYFAARLFRAAGGSRFRALLWVTVLALTALASLLGALAHGIQWSPAWLDRIWTVLYVCLGLVVALFLVGAVRDLRGDHRARRLLPFAIALGMVFPVATRVSAGTFLVFIVYEAIAMGMALAIYLWLGMAGSLAGAKLIALAIGLNLVAAWVQTTDLSLEVLVVFDHNGLFHMIQFVAIALLGAGLARDGSDRVLQHDDGSPEAKPGQSDGQ